MLTVLGGSFLNQAAAFDALHREASAMGIEVRAHQTDVVREAREVRLAHYFRPAIVARIEEALAEDDTIIILFPSQLTAEPNFPLKECSLRLLGRYAGLLKAST